METEARTRRRRPVWGFALCALATFFVVGPARAFAPTFPSAAGAPVIITNGELVTAILFVLGVALSWRAFAADEGGSGHRWLMTALAAGLGCALGALVGIVAAVL